MDLVMDRLVPGQQGGVIRQSRFQCLANTGPLREVGFLAEAGDPLALGDHDLTRIGCFITGQQPEEGAFPRSIAADETALLALEETETQSVQNGCRAISFRDIDQTQRDR